MKKITFLLTFLVFFYSSFSQINAFNFNPVDNTNSLIATGNMSAMNALSTVAISDTNVEETILKEVTSEDSMNKPDIEFHTARFTPPTVVVSTTSGSPINTTFTARFIFSESVVNFDLTDIDVTNGEASNFNMENPTEYTALITPDSDGENTTVSVAIGAFEDALGDLNTEASNVLSMAYDITKPTLTITTDASANYTNSSSFTATFTFSEDIVSFQDTDLTIVNATINNFVSVNDALFRATITPTSEGLVTIDLAADSVEDAANNGNVAATQYSVTYDATRPVATISSPDPNPTNEFFLVSIVFSEDVTGFDENDLVLVNGTISNFVSLTGRIYYFTVVPTITEPKVAGDYITINLPENRAEDNAGNLNTTSTELSVLYDIVNPTVTITSDVANNANAPFTATFTFDEDVSGFEITDIVVGNGTASNFTTNSASEYTATITPTAEGTVTVDVEADTSQDAATNGNNVAQQYAVLYDITKPTVTISSVATDPTNASFIAVFTFSEDVVGFNVGDITLSNAIVTDFLTADAASYIASIIPTTDGPVTIDVAANVAQDLATNGNEAATQFSIEYDATNPTVAITTNAADPINVPFTATFTFSEDVTGFEVGDITLSNATASDFTATSASVYTALITPTEDGNVTIDIAANVAQDAATNENEAATQYSVLYDATNPTISATYQNSVNSPFTVEFTFSEDVTGFDVSDISISNATLSDFTATSASVYSVLITPTAAGDMTLDIAADAAQDAATNGNVAIQLVIAYDNIPPSRPQITHISDYTCSGNVAVTGDNTLKISGTAERESAIEVFEGGVSIGTTTTDSEGFFTFDYTGTTLADGDYSFTVTATDTAMNTSALSTAFTIAINTVDTDNDGIPDVCDDDYDGNGKDDDAEDCDGDGIVDHLDTDNSSCTNSITETKKYGFSPNGDGINEGWVIENITAFPNNTVSVFARGGKLVFKKKNYQNDWDGVSNQISNSGNNSKLPVGPYIFVIDLGDGSTPTRGWLYINY